MRAAYDRLAGAARRLARDTRGNAMLIMAAGIVPVMAAVAGSVDMTRAYMADARLQQSVDAAALAGRKILSNTNVADGSPAELAVAKFIAADFPAGLFGAAAPTKSLNLSPDGNLCVTAHLSLPTVLMGKLSFNGDHPLRNIPLSETSCARRSGSNIDVILILDVTGSMALTAGSSSRMAGLKQATLDFLGTLDTTRTQLAVEGLRVRVGIVPYNSTANVGRLLVQDAIDNGSATPYIAATAPAACTGYAVKNCVWSDILYPRRDSFTSNNWLNADRIPGTIYPGTQTPSKPPPASDPRSLPSAYQPNLSSYVTAGGAAGTSVTDVYAWRGCVEARPTVTTITDTSATSSIPAGAFDLLDIAPGTSTSAGAAPSWRPYFSPPSTGNPAPLANGNPAPVIATNLWSWKATAPTGAPWNQLPYRVRALNTPTALYQDSGASRTLGTDTSAGLEIGPNAYCPAEAQLLAEKTKADLTAYVNSLTPGGLTLHDVGMFWGLAMISPGAPFVNASKYLKAGIAGDQREVKRYIVFMTDGDMEPNETSYSAYGYENLEQRMGVSGLAVNRTKGVHNTRFLMLCEAAKQIGVNISTVSFGLAVTSQLRSCASTSDQAYGATTSADLDKVFQLIANNIGYLRVSQ